MPDHPRGGAVDAALVYASSATALADGATAVPLPPPLDLRDRIVFTAGVVVRDGVANSAARRLLAFLLDPAGQRLLGDHGFLSAPRN